MPASNMLKLYYFTQAPEELLARTSLHRKDTDDDDQHGNGSGTAEIAAAAATTHDPPHNLHNNSRRHKHNQKTVLPTMSFRLLIYGARALTCTHWIG